MSSGREHPDLIVQRVGALNVSERVSNHDVTWSMKKESFNTLLQQNYVIVGSIRGGEHFVLGLLLYWYISVYL